MSTTGGDIVGRDRAPFDTGHAARLAAEYWGIDVESSELVGDVDRNFRLDAKDGVTLAMKIGRMDDGGVPLSVRQQAADAVGADPESPRVPGSVPARDGQPIVQVDGGDGRLYEVACTAWVRGNALAEYSPVDGALCRDLGYRLGIVDRALAPIQHPALDRDSDWDLKRGLLVAARNTESVSVDRRPLFDQALGQVRDAAEGFRNLPVSVIHGDANDYNVLVDLDGAAPRVGLIDFGDLVRSWRVAEPAIAAAYAAMDRADPVGAIAAIVKGYDSGYRLEDVELDAIPHLVSLRLCVSVALSAARSKLEPDDTYLTISERPAWDLLEYLRSLHPRMVAARIRAACGREPSPAGSLVSSWLHSHESDPAPVVDTSGGVVLLDLSVGGSDAARATDSEAWSEAIRKRIGSSVGVGRYLEPRLCYTGGQFVAGDNGPEFQRTVHLGVDLFARPGTAVSAPFDGRVESVVDNARPLDYGPTVILRHDSQASRPEFWTLFGHLDPEVLDRLHPGDRVARGEAFARIGSEDRNGGWPPHVHVQVIADLLDRGDGDFPGVTFPSEAEAWEGLCPEPVFAAPIDSRYCREGNASLLDRRNAGIGPSLSVSYRRPIHMVRGIGPWMFDDDGRRYLDCVNNVNHVGHAHPRVVEAAGLQMALLNTNTRYLHENLVCLAERLVATMPGALDTCFIVNSGSEANDLALRIARSATGRQGVVVVDGAYHGNLGSLIDISPYKFNGPGGHGRPGHVRVVRMPDTYRGELRTDMDDVAVRYADDVRSAAESLETDGLPAAAFMAESILSCGGQIVPPSGWLGAAAGHARAAGALYIADEVQTGLGRVGTHFWAFEEEGVVPDIVTIGKPIGNGHPVGAVVTTRALADAFDPGMEYFNTFGGNPVSCAVGLAVLDVIEDEGLQAHALETGRYLLKRLTELQRDFPLIGDVRGRGLFLGMELVSDAGLRIPDPEAASCLANRGRDEGVLLSTDGPDGNVIKIKPPLVFGIDHCDRLVELLRRLLAEDYLRGRIRVQV